MIAAVARFLLGVAPILLLCVSLATDGNADQPQAGTRPSDQASFEQKIRPLLEQYCNGCHGPGSNTGLDLTRYKTVELIQKDPQNWRKILSRISDNTMPPPNVPRPTSEEHSLLTMWIGHTLNNVPEHLLPKNPGRVVLHRLSGLEYNNTVRDLFSVTIKPADKFPADGGGGGGFDNNADTLYIPPVLMERYLEAATEVLTAAKPERLFFVRPSKTLPASEAARKLLTFYASRAYRRPATPVEIDSLMRLYRTAARNKEPFEAAVKFALKAVLISPHFLFRVQPDFGNPNGPRPLNGYELASRLSYFLWASLPDEELFRLAAAKKLHDPDVLEAQVTRMLKDNKARAFADSFAGQWLRVRELYTTAHPDTGKFPEYTPSLRDAMYEEPIRFFQSVINENRSILTFLDADYTFANEELAKHYGIPAVTGAQMRRVSLTDGKRGGLLTMGSVLVLSSYPQRTSPVLRGKWILNDLLGTPPPPPPPVVNTLSTNDQVENGLTFRQRLEKHREKPECAGCHSRLNPLGFALENYDAIGRWRDKIGDQPVDALGSMPDGTKFSGPVEFKKFMVAQRKDDFVRHLSEKMLSYALGRGIEPYDLPALKKIQQQVASDGFRARTLVRSIALSYPFRYRMTDLPRRAPATPVKTARPGTRLRVMEKQELSS